MAIWVSFPSCFSMHSRIFALAQPLREPRIPQLMIAASSPGARCVTILVTVAPAAKLAAALAAVFRSRERESVDRVGDWLTKKPEIPGKLPTVK